MVWCKYSPHMSADLSLWHLFSHIRLENVEASFSLYTAVWRTPCVNVASCRGHVVHRGVDVHAMLHRLPIYDNRIASAANSYGLVRSELRFFNRPVPHIEAPLVAHVAFEIRTCRSFLKFVHNRKNPHFKMGSFPDNTVYRRIDVRATLHRLPTYKNRIALAANSCGKRGGVQL